MKRLIPQYFLVFLILILVLPSACQKEEKNDPVPVNETPIAPPSTNGRPNKYLGCVEIANRNVDIEVWDHGTIDGDIISLIVNRESGGEETILNRHELDGPSSSYTMQHSFAGNGYNYLTLYAHNEGSISPNTASISIDGNDFTLSSNLNENGYVDIVVTGYGVDCSNSSGGSGGGGGGTGGGGSGGGGSGGGSTSTCTGSVFTDPRDGQSYEIVQIGDQCWFAENLNYHVGNSDCYDNDPANCDTYGRMYDWQTALTACPSGWHLPTDDEWTRMSDHLGGASVAGGKLKATILWENPNTGANNSSGFSALPGGTTGIGDGRFLGLGYQAEFWTATQISSTRAWFRRLLFDERSLYRDGPSKRKKLSCRCVKD